MASNLYLVYSGGSANSDPANSLGGSPSGVGVSTGVSNNLFNDITPDISTTGLTDYRCLYLFNDGDAVVYNISFWISNQTAGGCTLELGLNSADEVQRLLIPTTVTGGSITLSYSTHTFTVNYNSDLASWAQAFQTGINSLVDVNNEPLLGTITVTGSVGGGNYIFDFHFTNEEGSRSHSLMTVSVNSLVPDPTTATISFLQIGSPINRVAQAIDLSTTAPGSVEFSTPTSSNPLVIPKLEPTEGFSFWVKRTTPSGISGIGLDNLQITIRHQSLNPYR